MRILIVLAACLTPHVAAADKGAAEAVPVRVIVRDEAGAPVPTAVVRHPKEADRHRVNAATGEWEAKALYLPDGSEMAFAPGITLELEISAPGYLTKLVAHDVRKRRNQVDVVLEAIDLDATPAPDPVIDFAHDAPRDDAASAPAH
jgi:hypothetical protein